MRWSESADLLSQPPIAECVRRTAGAGHLNAFLFFDPGRVLADARSACAGELNGVAIAVKDNIDVAGLATTCGSAVDRGRIAERDAIAWARLRGAGATLLGKTHMSEFAYGPHLPALGPVRHPLDPERTPGTSSSGSAAAVAAGLCPAALGTDTGGSVRVPAAYCGLVGLKATHGLVPVEGVTPLAPSLDAVGILAREVADAATLLQLLAGIRFGEEAGDPIRVGIDLQFLRGCSPVVLKSWQRARDLLGEAGCEICEVQAPDLVSTHAAHRTVLLFEARLQHSSRLAAGAVYGPSFGAALKRGEAIPERRYLAARRLQERVGAELAGCLTERVDVMLTPTVPTVAPRLDARPGRHTRYTFLANFAGLPAVSIPAGTDEGGRPVGVQLLAGPHREAVLLRAAGLLEEALAVRPKS